MKIIQSFFFTLLFLFAACSTSKKAANSGSPQIVRAGYHRYSRPPAQGSTIPENGTDLAVIVKNWPQDAEPKAIIYDHRKSFKPEFGDTSDAGLVMNARIIRSSSVFHPFSPKVDKSDRLIYQTADSTTHFIEIEQWTEIQNLK